MRNRRLTGALRAAALAITTAGSAAGGVLTEQDLYDLTVEAATRALSAPRRLAPLPCTLGGAFVRPDGEAVLWMSRGSPYGLPPLDTTLRTYATRHEGFRLMLEGRLLGATALRAWLAGDTAALTNALAALTRLTPYDLRPLVTGLQAAAASPCAPEAATGAPSAAPAWRG